MYDMLNAVVSGAGLEAWNMCCTCLVHVGWDGGPPFS